MSSTSPAAAASGASIGYQPGARVPTHLVTPGVVMLGTIADSALDAWLLQHEFSARMPTTITNPALFRSHVQAARALGYWVTEAQLDAGLRGVAVVLKDRKGGCKGAVSTALPMQPQTREQLIERFVPLLLDCALSLRPLRPLL